MVDFRTPPPAAATGPCTTLAPLPARCRSQRRLPSSACELHYRSTPFYSNGCFHSTTGRESTLRCLSPSLRLRLVTRTQRTSLSWRTRRCPFSTTSLWPKRLKTTCKLSLHEEERGLRENARAVVTRERRAHVIHPLAWDGLHEWLMSQEVVSQTHPPRLDESGAAAQLATKNKSGKWLTCPSVHPTFLSK